MDNIRLFWVNKDDLTLTPIRASDAILLAHVAKVNIFMEEHLIQASEC